LNDRSNQCAQLFRDAGLQVGDLVAICMDNNARYFELCWAAQRAGLYFTCISNKLGVDEVLYIVGNSGAKMLFLSRSVSALAEPVAARCGAGVRMMAVDGEIAGYECYENLRDQYPATPIADETSGTDMLYSSGTTGMPKGIRVALPQTPIDEPSPQLHMLAMLYGFSPDAVYLSPAPLYHAAPLRYNMIVHRMGGTSIAVNREVQHQSLSVGAHDVCEDAQTAG
jgi:long-chain acyl-CoA synthetase